MVITLDWLLVWGVSKDRCDLLIMSIRRMTFGPLIMNNTYECWHCIKWCSHSICMLRMPQRMLMMNITRECVGKAGTVGLLSTLSFTVWR